MIAGSRTSAGLGIVQIRADENNNSTDYERIVGTFFPYGPAKVGEGVRVATGDFNGDGNDELVVATSNGLPVKIYALNATARSAISSSRSPSSASAAPTSQPAT